jgi:hypothetical protein
MLDNIALNALIYQPLTLMDLGQSIDLTITLFLSLNTEKRLSINLYCLDFKKSLKTLCINGIVNC